MTKFNALYKQIILESTDITTQIDTLWKNAAATNADEASLQEIANFLTSNDIEVAVNFFRHGKHNYVEGDDYGTGAFGQVLTNLVQKEYNSKDQILNVIFPKMKNVVNM